MVFGETDPNRIASAAQALGCAEVVVTDGARGSWWQDDDGQMNHQPSLANVVVDPVGAGDAFAGSYLAARLSGLGTRTSSWIGASFAAGVIAVSGDTEGLPTTDHVVELVSRAQEMEGASS